MDATDADPARLNSVLSCTFSVSRSLLLSRSRAGWLIYRELTVLLELRDQSERIMFWVQTDPFWWSTQPCDQNCQGHHQVSVPPFVPHPGLLGRLRNNTHKHLYSTAQLSAYWLPGWFLGCFLRHWQGNIGISCKSQLPEVLMHRLLFVPCLAQDRSGTATNSTKV